MSTKKPGNIGEYIQWLRENHGFTDPNRFATYYKSVVERIKSDLEAADFWKKLVESLNEYNEEYMLQTGYHLLMPEPKPQVFTKPFPSFLLKTFRKNILDNKNWPDPPADSWILPNSWFSSINDIARTLFVVKYLDGVDFLTSKASSLCADYKMPCRVFLEAREEGYYAAHLYTSQTVEIPKPDWDTEKVNVSLEIQITTQLQEVIRKLLHKYYESKREKADPEGIKWQWNYKSDEFIANYLGHILHYVEGMIMEVRERQREGVK